MELKEVLEKRTSIRKFKDDEVPVEIYVKLQKQAEWHQVLIIVNLGNLLQ
jgi:nitroreductase